MTGTASSRGRMFHNFDSYKNEEWLRRRKLRIEQVRKQSKEIAKALRQKVENEEKIKAKVFEKIEEARFKCWRAEKLDEMERKLRCALEEFGLGHKLAEAEPCSNDLIELKNKVNMWKAQERGEVAHQQEIKRKKMEEKIRQSPIQRKKFTRKVEDLRSVLICSVSNHKHLFQSSDNCHQDEMQPEKNAIKVQSTPPKLPKKVSESHLKKKIKNSFLLDEPVQDHQNISKNNSEAMKPFLPPQKNETIWINLNDVQSTSQTSDKKSLSDRIPGKENKIPQPPQDKLRPVEFYDYHSRYNCKSYGEYENLVERINYENNDIPIKPDESDEMRERVENEKKLKAKLACEERGQKALKKEKIKRDYKEMIAKLEDLNKKEKLIKTHQFSSTAVPYMTDERLSEMARTKQRIMNTKFESIYYNAVSEMPPNKSPYDIKCSFPNAAGDESSEGNDLMVKLKFSPGHPKNNSPVVPTQVESSSPSKTLPESPVRSMVPIKRKKRKLKKKLLVDIDRALKEGRKLRESLMHNWKDFPSQNEDTCFSESETAEVMESEKTSCLSSGGEEGIKLKVLDGETQTDDFKTPQDFLPSVTKPKVEQVDFAAQVGNNSLCNMSSSTSYKSPPSEINCHTFRPLLNCLDDVDDSEDHLHLKKNPELRRKVENMLSDLLCEMRFSENEETNGAPTLENSSNPELKYYIEKLLNMSRECVANLSVASDNDSLLNSSEPEIDCNHECDQSEEESACSEKSDGEPEDRPLCEFHSAQHLSEPVRIWKTLLARNDRLPSLSLEMDSLRESCSEHCSKGNEKSVSECTSDETLIKEHEEEETPEVEEQRKIVTFQTNSKTQNDLDRIAEKCSKRISELTDLLSQVRRNKESLLESISEVSGSSLGRRFGDPGEFKNNSNDGNEPETNDFHDGSPPMGIQEINSSAAVADKASVTNGDLSLLSTETFPDVMNELLDRRIITSPFKWCEGDFSKDLHATGKIFEKPASIETVIGDFRKRISRIKPFSLSSSGIVRGSFSIGENHQREISTSRDRLFESVSPPQKEKKYGEFQEKSFESMDTAFKNLGLNWAKSFLKKIEESKAMSSSSTSDEKKTDKNEPHCM